ncbi:MAG: nuclear transport factor 2 family protein [Candidatus Binataceae bacterium]
MENLTELQSRVDQIAKRLDELSSKEAIRECIYRINRGMDRIDRELMLSGFHPNAQIRWGTAEPMDLSTFIEAGIKIQHTTSRVQHLVGNILIQLHGGLAEVESYEIARHLTPLGEEKKDLIIASRYVDKFSRRDGAWRIERRDKVVDWIRILEGADPLFDNAPLKGRRDADDVSFAVFGPRAFHAR